jgi:hypothetical protein
MGIFKKTKRKEAHHHPRQIEKDKLSIPVLNRPFQDEKQYVLTDEFDFSKGQPLEPLINLPFKLPEKIRERWVSQKYFSVDDLEMMVETGLDQTVGLYDDFFDIMEEVRVEDDANDGFTMILTTNRAATTVSVFVLAAVLKKAQDALAMPSSY